METKTLIIILVVVFLCNTRMRSLVWPHPKYPMDRANDLIHTHLPKIPQWTQDATLVVTASLLVMYRGRVNWRKMVGMLILFYSVRLVCIMSTTLPRIDGRNDCKNGGTGDCTDYFFSGHTAFNLVASYSIGAPVFPWWPLVATTVTAMSREHYTIDVLMPWVLLGLTTAPALK